MAQTWLIAFILGALSGRCGATLASIGAWSAVCFAPFLLGALRNRKLVVGVAAFVWGASHAAPRPRVTMSGATVVSANPAYVAAGDLLVGFQGEYFEAYGSASPGARGEVSVAPYASLFGSFRARFVVRDATQRSRPLLDWRRLSGAVHHWLTTGTRSLERPDRQWLNGIVAGESSRFDRHVERAFRVTGLYHLLVVSGQHVTFVAITIGFVVAWPFQCLYSVRLISPKVWPHVASGLSISAAFIGFLYAASTGMSVASQRAAMSFAVVKLLAASGSWAPLKQRLAFAGTAQSVIFPIGFLSEAALMSWGASLLVIAWSESPRNGTLARRFARAVGLQLRLTILATAAFGQLAILSVIVNLVLVPVFSFLLASGFFVCLFPGFPWIDGILGMQRSFVTIVVYFGRLHETMPLIFFDSQTLPSGVRAVSLLLSGHFLLNALTDLSIRQAETGATTRQPEWPTGRTSS